MLAALPASPEASASLASASASWIGDGPAVLEGVDGGDRLDAHLLRDLGALVDVDLDHAHGAIGLAHRLFQQWPELLARPAPRRPEIDHHGAVVRGVDDVGHEGGGGAVLDEVRAARA